MQRSTAEPIRALHHGSNFYMNKGTDEVGWQIRLFKKSIMKQAQWREIQRMLPPMPNKVGLDMGYDSAAISYLLREGDGEWTTIVKSSDDSTLGLVMDRVFQMKDGKLPFDDESYDCLVIVGMLERVQDDQVFLRECHRVTKPAGRILIDVAHVKRLSLIRLIRKMFGMSCRERGQVHQGYSEKQLYKLVTDGFDVESSRTYSRFFVELVETAAQITTKLIDRESGDGDKAGRNSKRKLLNIYSIYRPFFMLASQLDKLIFFTRGHSLIIRARRRPWLPRKVPVLKDGRSIADAALNYRIGSANPY